MYIIHELSKVPRKWESGRALFILSILFNISEIADIMGNLTDGMRDLTGVINWRTHGGGEMQYWRDLLFPPARVPNPIKLDYSAAYLAS